MNATSDGPGSDLHEVLATLGHRYHLESLYAFGSRAEEIAARVAGAIIPSSHPDSDLDIGIMPLRDYHIDARNRVLLMLELEELFDVPRVDLVVLPEVETFLALSVIRGELLYCSDRHAQAEYELYIMRKAADLAPFARARFEQMLAGGGQ